MAGASASEPTVRSFQAIPAIDLRGGRCVRLREGDFAAETAYGDDPVAMAERWAAEGATRLHVVDLDGAARGARAHGSVIAAICGKLTIAVQVGGGLRDLDAIASVLDAGAERAILGTAAAADPELVEAACGRHPGRIAIGIDLRDGRVAVDGWTRESGVDPLAIARQAEQAGAAAIILTDVRRDGTGRGPSLDATVAFAAAHRVPVIVSGGVSSLDDVIRARAAFDGGANLAGIIIGRALYEGRVSLRQALAAAAGGEG
jgi:phosphoribosylformimino-5-aminoimidazole carboxamide ribotide isomerase